MKGEIITNAPIGELDRACRFNNMVLSQSFVLDDHSIVVLSKKADYEVGQ